MVRRAVIRKNRYFDSVFLMRVARRIASQRGMSDASAVLATEANRKVLIGMGYGDDGHDLDFAAAGPNDLVIALEGEETAVEAIAANADSYLSQTLETSSGTGQSSPRPRSISEAMERRPDCSLAVISVPGEYAAREARTALQKGLHVFLFSSNVAVDDERSLKIEARKRGLMVMGPDCGTAYLGGAGIGFANAVRHGPIGIVGSTGTGMQEFASLVHQAASGISNAIGTGSRDVSDAIGGISTLMGIDALEADPATEVIAVVSKPPGATFTATLRERLGRCAKPVVPCLIGAEPDSLGMHGPEGSRERPKLQWAFTIDEAVTSALEATGANEPAFLRSDERVVRERAVAEIGKMRPEQRHVRGLFAGGTFCYQAQAMFLRSGLLVHSNEPLHGMPELPDPHESRESSFVDMGAEIFVQGRPHPMIDASLRRKRLEREGEDPSVAVILLDFILGAISSPDPVGDLLGAVRNVQDKARSRGGHLCVVASVCGTDKDKQGLESQKAALTEAGVLVFPSGAKAANFCREAALMLAHKGDG
jgi:succinyl-CoA synthetase alpha subunit